MQILAHRGLWRTPEEQNTLRAFRRAFGAGFGIEADLRDAEGFLVIAHDPVSRVDRWTTTLLDLAVLHEGSGLPVALNVKSDGLLPMLANAKIPEGAFFFDMSTPELIRYAEAGVRFFTRFSDLDSCPLLRQAAGIWWDMDNLRGLGPPSRPVCLVSPELHGKPHMPFWENIDALPTNDLLMLCTDHPEAARDFFA